MKIEVMQVAGFEPSFKKMRNPKESHKLSDSYFGSHLIKHSSGIWESVQEFIIGPNDMQLAQKLILAGDEHAKHMRGILVYFDITAPDYWWDDMCTYEVGVIKLPSTSTMHTNFKLLTGRALQKARAEQKRGIKYNRCYVISYQTLRRIYFQRRSHRLPEFKKFCRVIESLPYAKELITFEKKDLKWLNYTPCPICKK